MSGIEIGFHLMIALNVVQFAFWSIQVQRLVDKLMSRNYHDYEASKGINQPKEVKFPPINEPIEDLSHLNGIRPY